MRGFRNTISQFSISISLVCNIHTHNYKAMIRFDSLSFFLPVGGAPITLKARKKNKHRHNHNQKLTVTGWSVDWLYYTILLFIFLMWLHLGRSNRRNRCVVIKNLACCHWISYWVDHGKSFLPIVFGGSLIIKLKGVQKRSL